MKKIVLIYTLIICSISGSSQIVGGDIYYNTVVSRGLEFSIHLYFKDTIGHEYININWGDGTSDSLPKVEEVLLPGNIYNCNYRKTHMFPAPLNYELSLEIPYWANNIVNIPSSQGESFSLSTIICLNPFFDFYNSPTLSNPPLEKTTVGFPFIFNPIANDLEGDSLVYKLVNCLGNNGNEIPGYEMPLASNSISINSITGDIIWDSPVDTGTYAIAIIIEEWRQGIIAGQTFRQMTILVEPSTSIDQQGSSDSNIYNVYPNPFKDVFTVDGVKPDDKIRIFDILGKEQIFEITSYLPYTISLSSKDDGLYFIMIERDKEVSYYKVIKQ